MARVSRKKQNLPTPAVDTPIRRWKTALYVRLSVEDNGKGSDSIENQTALLENYVASRSYLEKTALFVDNGYTGTDFLRPEFRKAYRLRFCALHPDIERRRSSADGAIRRDRAGKVCLILSPHRR